MHVFKRPLEEPDQKGGQLLNQTELKIIFGNLPPIYDVHMKMLAVSGLLVDVFWCQPIMLIQVVSTS